MTNDLNETLSSACVELSDALRALAATSAIHQRNYLESRGCHADGECARHPGIITWERHIARRVLEDVGIEFSSVIEERK